MGIPEILAILKLLAPALTSLEAAEITELKNLVAKVPNQTEQAVLMALVSGLDAAEKAAIAAA